MAAASLLFAALAVAASLAPAPWDLAALALAVAAVATGIDGFRRPERRGPERLRCAAAAFVGAVMFAIATTEVVLTTVAIHHLAASI